MRAFRTCGFQFKSTLTGCVIWGLSFKFSGPFSSEFLICKIRNLRYFSRFIYGYRLEGPPWHKGYVFNFFECPTMLGLMCYPMKMDSQ